ncbi:MAG: beta-1,4-galactosyltransferase [Candidatus Hydrogenedens sp.]|nr:beta-1,4-galactosyltransferase [Candidatus Hydrogenedens sp.]
MIYVTLGTMFLGFDRLVRKMDAIAAATGERVIIQTGLSKVLPQHAEHFDFRPHDAVMDLNCEARLVVAHAGIGVTLDALRSGTPFILVPRLKRFNEHMNDHQLDLARAVEKRDWGKMVLEVDELDALCAAPPAAPKDYAPDSERLVEAVRGFIQRVADEKRR